MPPFIFVMNKEALRNSINPIGLFQTLRYRWLDLRNHPYYFRTFGTCVFCGAQGEGKTLSAVQYILKLCDEYPRCILVSNVAIKDRPFNAELVQLDNGDYVVQSLKDGSVINTEVILERSEQEDYEPVTIEYTGLEMLKYVNNNEYGVIFFIDEIHLELNSLESKNVDIEVMVEISQQRKQRKHIVGTSQIFMRMAKPLREQIHDIVICRCLFGVLQFNKWIKGDTAVEKNGKLEAEVKGHFFWWHRPEYYEQYDTYTKMRRYNKEWNGRKRIDNIYNTEVVKDVEFKR